MDLERSDHWDDSQGPPPGAALPGSSSNLHPNGVAPPGSQGSQMFGGAQDQQPAPARQRQLSNGAAQGQVHKNFIDTRKHSEI